MRMAAPRGGSQETPDDMRVIQSIRWRRGSAPSPERTKSSNAGIRALFNGQKESSGEIRNARVAEGAERVGMAWPRCGSMRTPEGMRVVRRTTGER